MGRMSRKGFTLYELVISVVVLGALGLFVGVCGSLIYWLISSAHDWAALRGNPAINRW
jgi:prepilin-type N-terminal cleavage/methylation domain-containing protein